MQEEEFCLPIMIKKIRENSHQIKMIKTKLEMLDDPIFQLPDPAGIVDVVNLDEHLEPLDSNRALSYV